MLIVWGQNDPFFTVAGAKAFQRDLPKAELHLLDAGHFALEEASDFHRGAYSCISKLVKSMCGRTRTRNVRSCTRLLGGLFKPRLA